MKKFDFLLVGINAKYIHLNPALYSLKYSVFEELREHVSIAEYTINHVYEKILMDIVSRQPDAIGISCYIWNAEIVKILCQDLAKVLPHVPIWLGGPEAAWSDDRLFDELPITGIMYGDGEVVFPELLNAYVSWKQLNGWGDTSTTQRGECLSENMAVSGLLSGIRGLRLYNAVGEVIDTGMPETADMDRLPFFYDKADISNRIVYYESSRGCPFGCSYCLSAADRHMRYRSLSLVLSELQWFLDHKVPQVKFLDRTFNSDRRRTVAIWQYLLDHDNGVTNFHFEITADLMGQEEINLLGQMRPGLVQLEIGVQSTNPKTLEAINRRTDIERLSKVVEWIREAGNVHQHLDLIAGLPWEDMVSFKNSFNQVYGMKPSQLQLGFLKVLKGSPIATRTEEFGIVFRDHAPYEVLSTKWISYMDVIRLKGVEDMVETYYNSHQFDLTMRALEREFDSCFDLYDALASYGCRTNPEGRSLSRTGLYEQLRGFIHENSVNCAECFDTLLTMDYYLREHARKRPSFAVGRELPSPGHSKDQHREQINFDLERFLSGGEVIVGFEIWQIDYTQRSPITNNALLRKEIHRDDELKE